VAVTDFDRQHVEQIMRSESMDWFAARVIRLCGHADEYNLERLRLAFPEHVEAFEDWYHGRGFYANRDAVRPS